MTGNRDRQDPHGCLTLTKEHILEQVQALLDASVDNLQHTLIKSRRCGLR